MEQNNINFIEWDSEHKHYFIRLVGDKASQEIRLAKMKASEDMYEALKVARALLREAGYHTDLIDQALAKAEK